MNLCFHSYLSNFNVNTHVNTYICAFASLLKVKILLWHWLNMLLMSSSVFKNLLFSQLNQCSWKPAVNVKKNNNSPQCREDKKETKLCFLTDHSEPASCRVLASTLKQPWKYISTRGGSIIKDLNFQQWKAEGNNCSQSNLSDRVSYEEKRPTPTNNISIYISK